MKNTNVNVRQLNSNSRKTENYKYSHDKTVYIPTEYFIEKITCLHFIRHV